VTRPDRGSLLLAFGAGVGLVLAAGALLASGSTRGDDVGPERVATVNGVAIRTDDYERTVAGVTADRQDPVDPTLRRHILDRLVDEELLVQRGLELGLAQVDPRVRRELAAAVIAAAVAEADQPDEEPSATELAAFYDAERGFFTRPGRLHLRTVGWTADTPDTQRRAREATTRLRAGEDVDAVRGALGDAGVTPVPDGPLPPAKVADYLGATGLRTALELAPGGVSDPVRTAGALWVLILVARDEPSAPTLTTIETEVRAEWQRRAGERGLRRYLDELRARADVRLAQAP
jgi:hypothetical protein